MKVNKYEPSRFAGIAEPINQRSPIRHSHSQDRDAFKDFHRGAVTRPTGHARSILPTPVAILGFVALLLLFLWLLVNNL